MARSVSRKYPLTGWQPPIGMVHMRADRTHGARRTLRKPKAATGIVGLDEPPREDSRAGE